MDTKVNKWELVFDFSNRGDSNFKVMDPSEWKPDIRRIEGFDEASNLVFDFPIRYGGTMSDNKPASSAEHD